MLFERSDTKIVVVRSYDIGVSIRCMLEDVDTAKFTPFVFGYIKYRLCDVVFKDLFGKRIVVDVKGVDIGRVSLQFFWFRT